MRSLGASKLCPNTLDRSSYVSQPRSRPRRPSNRSGAFTSNRASTRSESQIRFMCTTASDTPMCCLTRTATPQSEMAPCAFERPADSTKSIPLDGRDQSAPSGLRGSPSVDRHYRACDIASAVTHQKRRHRCNVLYRREGRCHVVGGLVAKEHDENQLLRISVPSGNHSPGDLALSPVHAQLS